MSFPRSRLSAGRWPLVTASAVCIMAGCTIGGLADYGVEECDPRAASQTEDVCSRIAAANPCRPYQCDPATKRCVERPRDDDRDGDPPPSCGGKDCNDAERLMSSRSVEACEPNAPFLDNDCDGLVDEEVMIGGSFTDVLPVRNESDVRIGLVDGSLIAAFAQKLDTGQCIQGLTPDDGPLRDGCVFPASSADPGFLPRKPSIAPMGVSGYGVAYVDAGVGCAVGALGYRVFDQAGIEGRDLAACTGGAALPTLYANAARDEALVFYYATSVRLREDPLDACATAQPAALQAARVRFAASKTPDLQPPWSQSLTKSSTSVYPPAVARVGSSGLIVAAPDGTSASVWLLDEQLDAPTPAVPIPKLEGARGVALGVAGKDPYRVAVVGEIGCAPQSLKLVLGSYDPSSGRLELGEPVALVAGKDDFATGPQITWIEARKEWLVSWLAPGPEIRAMRVDEAGGIVGNAFALAPRATSAAVDSTGRVLSFSSSATKSTFSKGALGCI